jgi:hypothetical protein
VGLLGVAAARMLRCTKPLKLFNTCSSTDES